VIEAMMIKSELGCSTSCFCAVSQGTRRLHELIIARAYFSAASTFKKIEIVNVFAD
jgi:hypothetical protein